ncbi:hypothetical protein JH146_1086 [Methanocaldococcus bathoardescens]|uniref:Uncharacterized protein n=1 Tax=Methanocaldococcus bathoardescens TaxID=1301915 RepID=A0A076LK16_9EURY|nr:hypothetical protein [Methanocaldococcus bathoardescens]AIJ05929.1 hypothetical protein JH146_1086 [Methanocaldococcus bathoardescens]
MQDRQSLQSKIQLINEIKERVSRIRENLGLSKALFDIVDIKVDGKILTIYTKNRSDKSTIIGPGGWVVGKLREEMKDRFEIIRVEDYTDKVLFEKRVETIKSLFNDDIFQDICNYFLYGEIPKKKRDVICLVQCQYDLYVVDILSNIFNVKALTYDFPALVPQKTKEKILDFLNKRNIEHEFLKINFTKDEIKNLINSFPCGFLKDKIIKDGLKGEIFTSCLNCGIFKYDNGIIINFFELFPIKIKKDENYLNYCPLCIQSCKIEKNKEKFIKKVVKDVYRGFKEPTDASEEILSIIK